MPSLSLPADASSLTEAVVEAVRTAVVERELVPGQTYSVYQLADLLGVSRSPVREALLRLAEAGLVEIARNRGFRVVLPRAREVEEIIDVRLALEPRAAARVAREGTAEDLAALAGDLAALAGAAAYGDEAAFWAADRAVHRRLLVAAGNARAAAIVEQLRATTALLGPPTTATGRTLGQIHAEHAPIIEAVLARDPVAAEHAMHDHLTHTGLLLVRSVR